jgi:hypothetical protein
VAVQRQRETADRRLFQCAAPNLLYLRHPQINPLFAIKHRRDNSALAAPEFSELAADILNLPRPESKPTAAPDFTAAYRWLMAAAQKQESAGALVAAARTYALALQLPGYADDAAANHGVAAASNRVQELLLNADAPLPAPKAGNAEADRALAYANPAIANSIKDEGRGARKFRIPSCKFRARITSRPFLPITWGNYDSSKLETQNPKLAKPPRLPN